LIQELNNHKEFFPEDPIEDVGKHDWFLAKVGKQIVGWAGVTIKTNQVASVCRTGVFLEFRSQGIKRKLIRALERYAKSQGCTMMTSYCALDNIPSANSLISSGYKLYEPDYVFEGGPWLYWRKRLVTHKPKKGKRK
jgi:GNAT superfamily N-acetyltransferase